MRILALSGVARRDHHNAGNESVLAVSYSGGRAKFCFNILCYN
jgi:hypothetical protein